MNLFLALCTALILLSPPPAATAQESIERVVLENGLVLVIAERHTLPTVHISMAIQGGAVLDPEGKAGLAHLTAALLDEGTPTRTSKQIAEEIDFIGGSLGASGGMDYASASLTVLKKDLSKGLDLLSDILMHPVFPPEELERIRNQIIGGILAQKTDPETVAGKTFQEMVFKNHPYSHPVEGTEESLPNIQREDMVRFYQTYFHPDRSIMVIVGDVTRSEAVDAILDDIGLIARGTA